jgi:hypothetical protein
MYHQKVISKKLGKRNNFFVDILMDTVEKQDPDPHPDPDPLLQRYGSAPKFHGSAKLVVIDLRK